MTMPTIDRGNWQTLEPLLDYALDLSAEQRERWLRELSDRSPGLAADLQAFLAEEALADRTGFLELPELTLAGLELGAYRLERPLGQGGMGTVWLARRTDGRFEGVAALKLLNLAMVSPISQARFRREGSVLARLDHPGIAKLLDAGISPTGQPFLVLEYVDGTPIDEYIRTHQLDRSERLQLFLKVLDAVGHAHANLVVHRDLKPSNILVSDAGRVKLLDFGIAKLLDEDTAGNQTALTLEGGKVFTPRYAAPEQIRGEALTTATDVYSLGVLLYLLLGDKHPTAENCRTPASMVTAVLERTPAKLSLGDLDTILGKALRKNPADRYQTVTAFADDLNRYLRHQPITARADSMGYRLGKFVRRNRTGVITGLLIALGLIGVTVYSVELKREAERQRDAAVRNDRRSTALSQVQSVLTGNQRAPDGRELGTDERIALAERVLTRQFREEPWLVAEVMVDLSNRYYEAGDRETQRSMLARARDIARAANLAPQVALADCMRARSFAYDDLLDSAKIDLDEARPAWSRSGAVVDTTLTQECLTGEGHYLVGAGSPDSAIVLLTRAVGLMSDRRQGTNRLQALNELGEVLRLTGHARRALPYQREVIAELDSSGYADTEYMPNALTFLTGSLWELGEYLAVDSLLAPIVREQESIHGSGQVATMLAFQYGQAKLRLGELDSAEVWIGRAQEDTTEHRDQMELWLPAAVTELRLEQGRLADARAASATLVGSARGRRSTNALLKARVLRDQGKPEAASQLLEAVLDTVVPGGRPLTLFALPLVYAGQLRLERGDLQVADSLATLAIGMATAGDSVAFTRSVFVGRAELLRARIAIERGDLPGAAQAAERARVALAAGYGPANAWTRAAAALGDSLRGR